MALRINKHDTVVHNNLGNALAAKGQLDEAIAEYREAIAVWQEVEDLRQRAAGSPKPAARARP